MIRIKERAEVSPEFLGMVQFIAKERLRQIFEKMQVLHPDARHILARRHKARVANLRPIALGVREPGKGLDLELSRLRALEFERFSVIHHAGYKWLEGLTRNILMGGAKASRVDKGNYDIGPYRICILVDDILAGNIERIHMIPVRDPLTTSRHPHHTARFMERVNNPLDMRPFTCWNQFGEPVTEAMCDASISELFRILWIFLRRYNSSSPLTSPGSMPHCKDIRP